MADGSSPQIPDAAVEMLAERLWIYTGHESKWCAALPSTKAPVRDTARSMLTDLRPHLLAAFSEALLGDEGIEAVAKAGCERAHSWGHHEPWDDLHPVTRTSYLESARFDLAKALATLNVSGGGEQ